MVACAVAIGYSKEVDFIKFTLFSQHTFASDC